MGLISKGRRRLSAPVLLAAGLAVAFPGTTRAQDATPRPGVEQRLRALEDRALILQLVTSDYASAIDRTDTGALSELFTRDGEFASEWPDMAALPGMLGEVFTRSGTAIDGPVRPQIAFRGRAAIAGYMGLVVTGRADVRVEGGKAIATFALPAEPGESGAPGAPPGPPPGGPSNPMMARYVSMMHMVTNPSIHLEGDRATATSYWVEVATARDGTRTVIGGGYYSDELARVDGAWLFRRKLIHNFDLGLQAGRP